MAAWLGENGYMYMYIFGWLGVPIYVIFEQFKDHNVQLVIFMAFFDSLVLGFS